MMARSERGVKLPGGPAMRRGGCEGSTRADPNHHVEEGGQWELGEGDGASARVTEGGQTKTKNRPSHEIISK